MGRLSFSGWALWDVVEGPSTGGTFASSKSCRVEGFQLAASLAYHTISCKKSAAHVALTSPFATVCQSDA